MGGGSPVAPKPLPPLPPPAPAPPPAPPSDTEAQQAIPREGQRTRRRFSVRQTFVAGSPIGVQGDRPLGA